MRHYRVIYEYSVKVPEPGTGPFRLLFDQWFEDEGRYQFPDETYEKAYEKAKEIDPEDVGASLVHYLIERTHTGDMSDLVELVDSNEWRK